MILPEASSGRCSARGRDQDVFRQPFHKELVFSFSGNGGFGLQGAECKGFFGSLCGVCWVIWLTSVGWGVGGALQEGRRSYPEQLEVIECYVVVPVGGGYEVVVWVSGYGAKEYASSVGGNGQGCPHMGAGIAGCLCAMSCYGVRHRIYGEAPYYALCVVGDDGAEVCQSCCAVFQMVYAECVP